VKRALSAADGARFTITHARSTGRGVLARLAGVDDRTAAEALRGVELYVDRDRLPAAAEGEFYHADLIGLAVVDTLGQRHGEVLAVCNFGAGDLLEIGLPGSGDSEFVPFTEGYVPEVDLARGRVIVALPSAEGEHS
jgi:16S rRNA processing protein RimM